MFRKSLLMLLLMALPFSLQAQDMPASVMLATETAEQSRVHYENFHFSFDAGLADEVSVALYPAVTDNAQFPTPAFTEFTFTGYSEGEYLNYAPMPRIDFFPIEGFGDFPFFVEQLDQLSQILAERPDLNQYVVADTTSPDAPRLPFLPIFPAAQVFRAHPEYIQLPNIQGIRYLVYYSQAMNPLAEGEVFYTFQGISDDGQYYISAILPVNTELIPADWPGVDNPEAYQEYLMNIVGTLTAADPQTFSPTLNTLDALAASVRVGH